EAVAALSLLVDRVQCVGTILDIGDFEAFKQGRRIEISRSFEGRDLCVIVVAVADCFFEDRGVRGDAAQPVFGDQLGEAAAFQQLAADEIEPHRLSIFLKFRQRIGHDRYSLCASWAWKPPRHVNRDLTSSSFSYRRWRRAIRYTLPTDCR